MTFLVISEAVVSGICNRMILLIGRVGALGLPQWFCSMVKNLPSRAGNVVQSLKVILTKIPHPSGQLKTPCGCN